MNIQKSHIMSTPKAIQFNHDSEDLRAILERLYQPRRNNSSGWIARKLVDNCHNSIKLALISGIGLIIGAGFAVATEHETFRSMWRPAQLAKSADAPFAIASVDRLAFYNAIALHESIACATKAEPRHSPNELDIAKCGESLDYHGVNFPNSAISVQTAKNELAPAFLEATSGYYRSSESPTKASRFEFISAGGSHMLKNRPFRPKTQSAAANSHSRATIPLNRVSVARQRSGRAVISGCGKPARPSDCLPGRPISINRSRETKKLAI